MRTAIHQVFTLLLLSLLLQQQSVQARERCEVRFTSVGYGDAAGINAHSRQVTAKKRGKLNAYRALSREVGQFRLTPDETVASAASRNYNFRRQIKRKIRSASVVDEGYEGENRYKVELELCIVFPTAANPAACARPGTRCGKRLERAEVAEESVEEASESGENFLTRLAHRLSGPVLDPDENPQADPEQLTTVPPEDRQLPSETASPPGFTLIRDGVDMVLVEAVKREQKNAPVLFRNAVLEGMDREVALSSVLMGMVNPSPDALGNVINQAIALGITRGEVDRSVHRVKQACEVCRELENPAATAIGEFESGPVKQ